MPETKPPSVCSYLPVVLTVHKMDLFHEDKEHLAREPGRSASENWIVWIIFQGKDGGTIETREN